ncbi:MAG: alpha/beta hydrolase [Bryobacterales bacterium]|nr:alpha/beta hydrolase [Bryobacterales bacterium]
MPQDVYDRVEHHYADSGGGVKIHYAALGPKDAPLILMIHGFPDFWYSWRHQMAALAARYRVVAMDQRGYNLSDKPEGVENYAIPKLVGDAVAVIRHAGREKATVVGHDWGGMVAWGVAMYAPQAIERLIIVNLPHPRGLVRELASNPEQRKNSEYARRFQHPDAHKGLTAEKLAESAPAGVRPRYVEAFGRSDFGAMLNYYRSNYPREPYTVADWPKVRVPVLQFHGLKDWALLPGGLDCTWEWVDAPWTLVTLPDAAHWAHWDAADAVTRAIEGWLDGR